MNVLSGILARLFSAIESQLLAQAVNLPRPVSLVAKHPGMQHRHPKCRRHGAIAHILIAIKHGKALRRVSLGAERSRRL